MDEARGFVLPLCPRSEREWGEETGPFSSTRTSRATSVVDMGERSRPVRRRGRRSLHLSNMRSFFLLT